MNAVPFFRIHENSKTSKYEKILYAERKKIGLEAASNANSKYQRNRIILEIKRLDLKIETVKNFNKISQSKTPFNKLFFIIILILIFLKAPFKLRDFYFLGYLKKALKLLIRY